MIVRMTVGRVSVMEFQMKTENFGRPSPFHPSMKPSSLKLEGQSLSLVSISWVSLKAASTSQTRG